MSRNWMEQKNRMAAFSVISHARKLRVKWQYSTQVEIQLFTIDYESVKNGWYFVEI